MDSKINTSDQTRVLEWIEGNREEVTQFLQELIRVPSVTPWFKPKAEDSREKEVQEVIGARMEGLGAEVKRWEPSAEALAEYEGRPGYYADHTFEGRPNQAATLKGSGGGRSLMLTGHIDVVPAASGWTVDPFGGELRDGRIYGRGAVDMKGGVAAMVMALEAVVKSGVKLKGDVVVGTVVDEEAGGMGTLDLVAQGYRADACILTEPTNLKVAPLCRGILWGKLVIEFPPDKPSVRLQVNGEERDIATDKPLVLNAGERITLTREVPHAFWAETEYAIVGEVSTANDDTCDNFFANKDVGRFSEIDEDEPAIVKLVSD